MNNKEKEELNCRHIMEALVNQLNFEQYRDWLDDHIPPIMHRVLLQEGILNHAPSQALRIRDSITAKTREVLKAFKNERPESWADTVTGYALNRANKFLKDIYLFDRVTDPKDNKGESLENGWIIITIGDSIPLGNWWWIGYFNLGWKYIYPRTIVPKWDISLITGVKS